MKLTKVQTLFQKIHDISVDEKRNHLQSEMAELKSVNNRLSEIITRLSGYFSSHYVRYSCSTLNLSILSISAELEEHLGEFEVSDEKLTRELEDCQEQQKDLEAQVADFSKQVDLICTKQSAMQTKREEITKKVFPLQSLLHIRYIFLRCYFEKTNCLTINLNVADT